MGRSTDKREAEGGRDGGVARGGDFHLSVQLIS